MKVGLNRIFQFHSVIRASREVFVQPCVPTESLWYSDKEPSWLWQVSTLNLFLKRKRFFCFYFILTDICVIQFYFISYTFLRNLTCWNFVHLLWQQAVFTILISATQWKLFKLFRNIFSSATSYFRIISVKVGILNCRATNLFKWTACLQFTFIIQF